MAHQQISSAEVEAVTNRLRAAQMEKASAYRASVEGVRFSGMDFSRAPVELSAAALHAKAVAEIMARADFKASPRGRFVTAISDLQECGAPEAEELYSLYSRSFRDDRQPLNTVAVGKALKILAPINTIKSAREATAALADLLAADAGVNIALRAA